MKELYLIPLFDSAKSFYNKARVKKYYNKDYTKIIKIDLISYSTIMLSIDNKNIVTFNKDIDNYSVTTLRHLKEFIYQYNELFKRYPSLYKNDRITKKDIIKYIEA